MSYPVHIVVKQDGSQFRAGASSKVSGRVVQSFGKWFGSQMKYKPYQEALNSADRAAKQMNLNQ